MTDFVRWQQWAAGATDSTRANACAALGVVAASQSARRQLLSNRNTIKDPDLTATVLRSTVRLALLDGRWAPPPEEFLNLPLTPEHWDAAWRDALPIAGEPLRLRLGGTTEWDELASWSQLLAVAVPAVDAATWSIAAPCPQLVVRWPLRFATMPGNTAASGVESTVPPPWAPEICQHQAIERGQANCDVLVHEGTSASLLDQISAMRISVKANLIVLASLEPIQWDDAQALLGATYASGIVAAPALPDQLFRSLQEFLFRLAHGEPFDVAMFAGFVRQSPPGSAIAATDALAHLSVRDLALRVNDLATARLASAGDEHSLEFSDTRSLDMASSAPQFSTSSGWQPPLSLDTLPWDKESEGATTVAVAAKRLDAQIDQLNAATVESRFLQARPYTSSDRGNLVDASNGFVAGRPAEVRVRIAPRDDESWTSLDSAFPTHRLPQDRDEWSLTIWLTEPNHVPHPTPQRITLRHAGASSEAAFRFTPEHAGPFEGRVTVLHRGRVLQTAVLLTQVHHAEEPPADDAKPELTSLMHVRRNLADLEGRREFDASFIFNKTSTGLPRMAALSAEHAFVTDLDAIQQEVTRIYTALSSVENNVAKYKKGLDDENGRAFLVDIARSGAQLHSLLIKRQLQITAPHWPLNEAEYLQVIHTKISGIVPLEFVYGHASPDKAAKVCSQWRATLAAGKHRCTCNAGDRLVVCPLGFWGLSKVIERHLDDPTRVGSGLAHVQNEPSRALMDLNIGGAPLIAWSQRVTDEAAVSALLRVAETRFGASPRCPTNWEAWRKAVSDGEPRLLLAMPHTNGTGGSATLEIGGIDLDAADLTPAHVCCDDRTKPLVVLLGCDTGSAADDYAPYVIGFQDHGAAVVICTVATVFGAHAPAAAKLLIDALLPDNATERRLGEVLRSVKQQGLLANLLMPLCLVAYGDADWRIVR